jgi:hypothetical protein
MKYFLSIILVCVSISATAQHHYKGVGGIEVNVGSRLTGEAFNIESNVFLSKYINYNSYYKIGLNYFVTDLEIPGQAERSKAYNYHLAGKYSYTIAAFPHIVSATDIFFNLQGGAFMGIEHLSGLGKYRDPGNIPYVHFSDYRRNTFVLGPTVTAELEVFISKRVAILLNVSEYWTPLSKVEKWHTTATAGIKFLMY